MSISPMMDASATNVTVSQINFIEFVVAPFYASFVRLFPETSILVGHLVDNRIHYQTMLENELDSAAPSGANPHAPVSAAVAAAAATGNPMSDTLNEGAAPFGTQAGVGKTVDELLSQKVMSRNRFKALVERLGLLQSPAAAFFSSNPAYDILMLGGKSSAGTGGAGAGPKGSGSRLGSFAFEGGLTPLPVSLFGSSFQDPVRRERFNSNTSVSSTGSAGGTVRRRSFFGAATSAAASIRLMGGIASSTSTLPPLAPLPPLLVGSRGWVNP